jgi:C4-dicarboxylate transporter DctM subunit
MTLLAIVGIFLLLILCLGSGMRIAFAMTLSGLVIAYWVGGIGAIGDIVGYSCWNSADSFVLVTIPLFVLMASIISESGVTENAYNDLNTWLHYVPGRLLVTNIVACAIFAAICGSSAATTATIGKIAVPTMRAKGYRGRYICGTLSAGGTLGILIPPSITFIIYGSVTDQSVGQLFIAGVIPGIILTLLFTSYIVLHSKLRGDMAPPSTETYTWGDRLNGLKSLIPFAFLIFLIMGSLYSGIATATEAAAVGALGALIITILARKLSLNLLKKSLVEAVKTSSWLVFLLMGANILGYGMSLAGVPRDISQAISQSGLGYTGIILLLLLMYILLGCLIDPISMILITMPIVYPILLSINADPIWFGVIIVLLSETGLLTPPVGMNLFVVQGASGYDLNEIMHGVIPYIFILFLMITLIVVFPILATWLPSHMY